MSKIKTLSKTKKPEKPNFNPFDTIEDKVTNYTTLATTNFNSINIKIIMQVM